MAHLREWVFRTPFKPGLTPLAAVPNLEQTLFDYYYRGAYDEWWAQECNDFERYFDRHADVPAVFSGGWYDPFAVATTTYFAAMAAKNTTPQRLIMGPWTHTSMRGAARPGPATSTSAPTPRWGDARYNEERLRWFDRWLQADDATNGVEDEPRRCASSSWAAATGAERPRASSTTAARWRDGAGVAAGADALRRLLSAGGRRAERDGAGRRRPAGPLHLRPEPPGADDRRHGDGLLRTGPGQRAG